MAAAYAALVSLFNNLDQIHNHPRFSASFDPYQTESLRAHIDFFLDFVERYNIDGGMSRGVQELRSQIVRAAHEAEDITESHIVNQILPESAEISDVRLHHRCLFGLQKVIQDMDSIKDKVLKIKEEESGFNYQKPPNSTPPTTTEQNRMVGFEYELMQLKDVLIGQQSSRQIISIVGMGGTGKTTLAKYVYQDSLTMHHFELRAWAIGYCQLSTLSSSISLLWNLQTLVIVGAGHLFVAPSEIWKMAQLRHLKFDRILLPDPPPNDDEDFVVLENLQTLTVLVDFRLSEEVCKRIPNIKKLCLEYGGIWQVYDNSLSDHLQNIGRLQRLESLDMSSFHEVLIKKLKYTLPSSLKKLSLSCSVYYEDFSLIIGSLPQLEVLILRGYAHMLKKWSCVAGGFLRLKFLTIDDCFLESWTLDRGSCFPVLEKLVLIRINDLYEIPSGMGEISTLQLIRLDRCTGSLVISAMKIKEEQESYGNDGLLIQVKIGKREQLEERLKEEGFSINSIHLDEI